MTTPSCRPLRRRRAAPSRKRDLGLAQALADGRQVAVAYSHFLGYEKSPDGNMQIVEEEAKVVREIYAMFLDGKTPSGIAAALTKRSVPTPAERRRGRPAR